MAKSYATTEAMKNAAKSGLALREKYKRGGLSTSQAGQEGVGSGVARASDIISGSLSLESVKRMHAFFSRHENNYRPDVREADDGPTAGTIAWKLWGGSAGRAWARGILRREGLLKEMNKALEQSEPEELRQVTYIAMQEGVDAHGDFTSLDEIRKAKESFNKQLFAQRKLANLWHIYKTEDFDIIESYILPADIELEDKQIKKGTWLVTLQVHSEELWKAIKSNEVNGVSIGGTAMVQNLDQE